MPFYNSNPPARYGTGLRYKSASGPQSKHVMKKVLRNWNRKSRKERIAAGRKVVTKITGNADLPNPAPSLAVLTAGVVAAEAAQALVEATEALLKEQRLDVVAKVDAMVKLMDLEASTAEGATGGEEVKLVGLGFEVQQAAQAIGEMPVPQNLRATSADSEGELDCVTDSIYGFDSMEWQTTENPNDGASWVTREINSQSVVKLKNLPSGKRLYVRVRAIGPLGPGPWSDIASKMVP